MTRRLIAAGWLRRKAAPREPEPVQAVTSYQPPWHYPRDPAVTWLTACEVPLPGWPLDPVVFGPGLGAGEC